MIKATNRDSLSFGVGCVLLAVVYLTSASHGESAKETHHADLIAQERVQTAEDFDLAYPPGNGWHNLGYFNDSGSCRRGSLKQSDFTASSSPVPCAENLARMLALEADLHGDDIVVDVGVGEGMQDQLFVTEFDVAKLTGYNIGQEQIARANEKKSQMAPRFQERISFQVGDAAHLVNQLSSSATKVLSLESAFCYHTREDFFREAFRILRPGGVLALFDMVPAIGVSVSTFLNSTFTTPKENAYHIDVYVAKLFAVGFEILKVSDVTHNIVAWRGGAKFYENIDCYPPKTNLDQVICLSSLTSSMYVLVARKPMGALTPSV